MRGRNAFLLLTLCAVLCAAWTVRDVSGPLIGGKDSNYFEYLGYFVRDHLRFAPLPTIDFHTSEVAYPFGTSIVYLSWCAERDMLCAALLRMFGAGPWVQLYCGSSVVLSSLGVALLLRKELGDTRACLTGFAAGCMNFYAAFKFPVHLNMTATHWMVMSITVDFLLARYVYERRRLSALLLLQRVTLLGLVVGLDIAYVAGYALVSFTLTLAFCIFMLLRRKNLRELLPRDVAAELAAHPGTFALCALGLGVAVLLYVPFDLSVVRGSFVYSFPGAGGNFWASQFRMLLPYLPFAHPGSSLAESIFGEAEGMGEFSVGWALLAAGGIGLYRARKEKGLIPLLPLLLTFLLCLAFHPARLPTLHAFPWFRFNRVAGRATMFFPLALGLFAVATPWTDKAKRWSKVLLGLALFETCIAYGVTHRYKPERLDDQRAAFFRAVKAAPGPAVLEWPFCIAGANGTGTSELCPYYGRQSTVYAYRRLHEKSVVSHYLSRLHPTQLAPWFDAGFPALFQPDLPDPHDATRQTRCFSASEWEFFDAFYGAGDFAGLIVYADLLAPGCLGEFDTRYGRASTEAALPGIGRALFYPKAESRRAGASDERARAVRLRGVVSPR